MRDWLTGYVIWSCTTTVPEGLWRPCPRKAGQQIQLQSNCRSLSSHSPTPLSLSGLPWKQMQSKVSWEKTTLAGRPLMRREGSVESHLGKANWMNVCVCMGGGVVQINGLDFYTFWIGKRRTDGLWFKIIPINQVHRSNQNAPISLSSRLCITAEQQKWNAWPEVEQQELSMRGMRENYLRCVDARLRLSRHLRAYVSWQDCTLTFREGASKGENAHELKRFCEKYFTSKSVFPLPLGLQPSKLSCSWRDWHMLAEVTEQGWQRDVVH